MKSEWQENVHSVIVPLVFGTRKGDIFGFSNLKHTTKSIFPVIYVTLLILLKVLLAVKTLFVSAILLLVRQL